MYDTMWKMFWIWSFWSRRKDRSDSVLDLIFFFATFESGVYASVF